MIIKLFLHRRIPPSSVSFALAMIFASVFKIKPSFFVAGPYTDVT